MLSFTIRMRGCSLNGNQEDQKDINNFSIRGRKLEALRRFKLALIAKCPQINCEFISSDEEFMDAALNQLEQHYRNEHPTKLFRRVAIGQAIESLNRNFDEVMEGYWGDDWNEILEDESSPAFVQVVRDYCRSIQQWLDNRSQQIFTPSCYAQMEAFIAKYQQHLSPNQAQSSNPPSTRRPRRRPSLSVPPSLDEEYEEF